jgi:hypothetical protein
MSQNCEIGEINPGFNNPSMSPGHNNAIYCLICAPGEPQTVVNFQCRSYTIWDEQQQKYKYYLKFIPIEGTEHHLGQDEIEPCTLATVSDNAYWQVQAFFGFPHDQYQTVCTDGLDLQQAGNTGAIIIQQKVSLVKPPQ